MSTMPFDESYQLVPYDRVGGLLRGAEVKSREEVVHDGHVYQIIHAEKLDDSWSSWLASSDSLVPWLTRGVLRQDKQTVEIKALKLRSEITVPEYIQRALAKGKMPELTDRNHPQYKWMQMIYDSKSGLAMAEMVLKAVDDGTLVQEIAARRSEIRTQKEGFKVRIAGEKGRDPVIDRVRERITEIHRDGGLVGVEAGAGGAYFLYEKGSSNPSFVVKPADEDSLALNNRKQLGTPFIGSLMRARDDIPHYESTINEALASDVAEILDMGDLVPRTVLTVIEDDGFHDITDGFPTEARALMTEVDKEKLCSAQTFVTGSRDLQEEVDIAESEGRELVFDQKNFEDANIFAWMIGEQDGHTYNYRVRPKDPSSPELELVKIDSGLCMGEGSSVLTNGLTAFDKYIERPLSERGKRMIMECPIDSIIERMRFYGKSEASINNLRFRIEALQGLLQKDGITLGQINRQMRLICRKVGLT